MSIESAHSLLRRQLKRCFGSEFRVPPEWSEFIASVDATYQAFAEDQEALKHSLELRSRELVRAGAEMQAVFKAIPDLLIRLDEQGNTLDLKVGEAGPGGTASGFAMFARAAGDVHIGAEFRSAVKRVVATKEMVVLEYSLGEPETRRHFEARLAPVLENQVAAFIRDITGRKRAEEELFTSREMLRTILDTIPQRVFWKDRNSTFLGCNRPLANDFGYRNPGEIVGRNDYDSSEMANRYREDDRQVMSSDRPKLNYEEPQQRANGVRRWLKTSKVPLHDKDGTVIGVLGTYEDITEHKQAETLRAGQNRILEMIASGSPLDETLGEIVRLVESLVDGARCSILLLDADGRTLRMGAAPSLPAELAHALDGVPIGEGATSCGAAAARKQVVIVHDIEAEPTWRILGGLTARFGIRAWWSAPIISSHDMLLGTFGLQFRQPRGPSTAELELVNIATHIAGIAIQRQYAEQELRRTVSLVRSTLESTADGILVVDRDGRIVSFNERFVALWQIPQHVLATRDDSACLTHVLTQLKSPEDFLSRVRALYAEPLAESLDTLTFKDGRVFERYSCPQRLDGVPIGRVWSFRDVSQRIRLEEQFRHSQKMDAIGQLAGGVAHDFNNLLTVILGNLSLIRLGDLPAAQEQTAIEDCFRAAQRAANLTGQLLTFSRRQRLELQHLDLNEVVTTMTKMLQRLIGEHITLTTNCAQADAHVRADRGMMEQILMNVALNARDAMPDGGRLILSTAMVDFESNNGRVRAGSFVRLSISDTGSGIAPEHLPHIFEPFFTTKEVGKGTGLGLATVFGIVEQHGGWLDVDSELGLGTTIHVFIPRLTGGRAMFATAEGAMTLRGGSETILLAEDEEQVRVLMCMLLTRHGYCVHAAASGVKALELWQQHKHQISLLVTDMIMPGGIGGRELADRLLAEQPALRVIYCSGYTDQMLVSDRSSRGRTQFLEKPFDVHVFLERVRMCLDAPMI